MMIPSKVEVLKGRNEGLHKDWSLGIETDSVCSLYLLTYTNRARSTTVSSVK